MLGANLWGDPLGVRWGEVALGGNFCYKDSLDKGWEAYTLARLINFQGLRGGIWAGEIVKL